MGHQTNLFDELSVVLFAAGALVAANLREYALPVYIVTLAELWTRVAG